MKKTLAILTIVGGIAAASQAQGTFQWGAPSTLMVAQTNTTSYSPFETSQGSPANSGVGLVSGFATQVMYYALLTSSGLSTAPTTLSQFTSGSLSTAWLDTGLYMTNTAANNGRMSPVGGGGNAVVANNWASGSTQNAIMVGWSGNLGTTWAAALATLNNWATVGSGIVGTGYFGLSSDIAIGITPTTGNPGQSVFGTSSTTIDGSVATGNPVQLQQLYVATVPEPATMVLAGLGGLSLLAFRRKK